MTLRTYMLQVWYWNIQEILEFPSNTKIFDDSFGLTTEITIDT